MAKLALFVWPLALALLPTARASAQASGFTTLDSPRWTYEIRGVYFRPDLEDFAKFYGDSHSTYPGIAGTYRFGDRLELGGEYGLMNERGVGVQSGSGALGGSVKYRVDSFHVFANVIFQSEPTQVVVPYVGAGLLSMRYRQEVELQPTIEGRTDLGWSARTGVRFKVASQGPVAGASGNSPYWRGYVFLEAQRSSAKVDAVNLGGDAVVVGFRMEFEFP